MITMHLLQFLSNEGHGTIDETLHWEKMPLNKDGVAIFSRGDVVTQRNSRVAQAFDLYSRDTHDLYAADKLEKILETFWANQPTCTLPAVPQYSNKVYQNTIIQPITNVENLELDQEGKIVFRLSGRIIYEKGE